MTARLPCPLATDLAPTDYTAAHKYYHSRVTVRRGIEVTVQMCLGAEPSEKTANVFLSILKSQA